MPDSYLTGRTDFFIDKMMLGQIKFFIVLSLIVPWKIAQGLDFFCDFGRKSENLSMPVNLKNSEY